MAKTVLLDSGFLIRLMNPNEPLHCVALDLFKDYVSSGVEARTWGRDQTSCYYTK